jgi:hypothetical protein
MLLCHLPFYVYTVEMAKALYAESFSKNKQKVKQVLVPQKK